MIAALTLFLRGFSAGRLHHAYILSGPPGAGKEKAVLEMASLLIHFEAFPEAWIRSGGQKQDPGYAEVESRVARKIHPDLMWIEPEERTLKVDDVRTLARDLAFAPLAGKRRIIVLNHADRLNKSAANAILKILEEPPSYAVFFLLAQEQELLLPTLRSRSQNLVFSALSDADIAAGMRERAVVDPKPAELAEAVSHAWGSAHLAERYFDDSEYRTLCLDAQDALLSLWEQAPQIPKNTLAFVDSLKGIAEIRTVVQVWLALLRDFAVARAGNGLPETAPVSVKLFRADRRERLYRVLNRFAFLPANLILERVSECYRVLRELDANVNPKLLIVVLCGALQVYDTNITMGTIHVRE